MSGFEATTHYFRQAARVMELSERVQLLLINQDIVDPAVRLLDPSGTRQRVHG
jgi:hypothetical protein